MLRLVLASVFVVSTAGCASTQAPELRVLGVREAARQEQELVFVQISNPAKRPMRLTKLEYTFNAHGGTVSRGEVPLAREIPAGGAAVVEVPLELVPAGALTLRGKLTAELDEIVRTFVVSAQVNPES